MFYNQAHLVQNILLEIMQFGECTLFMILKMHGHANVFDAHQYK